tara:strand:- start:57 stop:287 length:231 start_codon:yes stop_codon:yes gene_type:complete
MAYGMQLQAALDRLDQSLFRLRELIKRGENKAAMEFMERGALKDRYDELQNIITIAGGPGSSGLGATGTVRGGTIR